MVGFRNAVGSAPMTHWTSPHPQQIAFGRGLFFILLLFVILLTNMFEALLDMWQSITTIRSGMQNFLLRFLMVNIVM